MESLSQRHGNIRTFTATLTVDMDVTDFPFLTPLLQKSVSFTVIIESTCQHTTFMQNNSILNKINFVGDEPVIWRFSEW